MKILLDTNIILDYALERSEFIENAREIMKLSYSRSLDAYISASSVTDIYYIVRKSKSKEQALLFLQNILSFIDVAGVNKIIALQALNSNFNDFEDAMQNFSASNSGVEIIVTRNKQDFKTSQLQIFEPSEFIEYLKIQTE